MLKQDNRQIHKKFENCLKRIKELEQANRELGDTNNKIIEENILFNRKKE
jgi:hypothetical protein